MLISPLPPRLSSDRRSVAAGDEDQEEDDDTPREREPVLMTGETNRHKVVPVNPPELVVLADGSCIVDGVPTDFVALLRDKVAAKTAQYSSARLRREFKAMDVDSNGRLGAKEFRRFLEPYNLNLVRAATVGLVCDCCRDSDGRPLLRTEPRRAEASVQAL